LRTIADARCLRHFDSHRVAHPRALPALCGLNLSRPPSCFACESTVPSRIRALCASSRNPNQPHKAVLICSRGFHRITPESLFHCRTANDQGMMSPTHSVHDQASTISNGYGTAGKREVVGCCAISPGDYPIRRTVFFVR
jgi:hypothetical protein